MTDSLDKPAVVPLTNDRIEVIEGLCLKVTPEGCVDMPVTHRFGPGVYIREIFMPAGTFVIGHEHKTEHFNIVLSGRADVIIGGQVREIKAPATFLSQAGVRKVLFIHEDMTWQTVHPTAGLEACGEDVAKLEDALRVKSQTCIAHELQKLQMHVEKGETP